MPNIDWIAIKNEYINTNISQRKLAEKYNISASTLTKRANKEKWQQKKETQGNKIETKVQQKTADIIISSEVNRIENLLHTSDAINNKLNIAIEQVTKIIDVYGEIKDTELIDVDRLRKLGATLKDVASVVGGLKSDNNADAKLETVLDKIEGNI